MQQVDVLLLMCWFWFSKGVLWDSVRLQKEAVSCYSLKGKTWLLALPSVCPQVCKAKGANVKYGNSLVIVMPSLLYAE